MNRACAVALCLSAFVLAGHAVAAPGDELCKRDLFMADAALSSSYIKMERSGAKPEEQCTVWRQHADVLRKSSATYGRCAVGAARGKAAELNGSAGDLQRLIGERCKGR